MNKLFITFLFTTVLISCSELPEGRTVVNLDMRSYMSGQAIYAKECAACHGEKGEGYGELYPALADSSLYESARKYIPCSVREGRKNGTVFMPSFEYLNYENTTDLVNFLIEEHAGSKKFYTAEEVKELLNTCKNP